MSHGKTERDGVFVVRDAAWHGLAKVFPDYPTREEAQALAHPWEPVSEPVYRQVPRIEFNGMGQEVPVDRYEEVEGYRLNVRSDDSHPIGVVSNTFVNVPNAEMYDIAEKIEGEAHGAVKYETGGSLLGGRKVWLLICLREPLVINGDPNGATIPYFAMQNSHDGSGAFRGQSVLTRIVCDNTSHAADLEAQARGTEFVFRHTKNVEDRIGQARAALAGWRDSVQRYRLFSEELLGIKISARQQMHFVKEFIPLPMASAVSDRVVENVEVGRVLLRDILASQTCEGVGLTAYGLVQGAIEYNQHARRARTQESRFKRAYLDRSRITSDAIHLARKAAMS